MSKTLMVHNNRVKRIQNFEPMKSINTILSEIDKETDVKKLVQIIELAAHKLNIKTISDYAKDNNISYNGAKNNREQITIGNVKFVVDNYIESNLPF